ncbi:hypothetical protein BC835DRAFT_400818 [Cytidiella melzeri]|nr:hypothetical protein BC835DRAFT_400818 [Cytidiella melzeri]
MNMRRNKTKHTRKAPLLTDGRVWSCWSERQPTLVYAVELRSFLTEATCCLRVHRNARYSTQYNGRSRMRRLRGGKDVRVTVVHIRQRPEIVGQLTVTSLAGSWVTCVEMGENVFALRKSSSDSEDLHETCSAENQMYIRIFRPFHLGDGNGNGNVPVVHPAKLWLQLYLASP